MSDEGHVVVPGGRVWYRRLGGGRIPLLCLHGGPGATHDALTPLAALADEREVIFYDQLGSGRSDRASDPALWTLGRSLAELAAVREALGLEELHLLGQSWGGLLAVEHALDGGTGLASLLLTSPLISVPRWVEDAERLKGDLPEDVRATIDQHERSGFTHCPEYVAATLVFAKRHVCRLDPWPEELERMFAGFGAEPYETMWGPSEFTQTGNLAGRDPTGRLGELAMPVLFTCGRHDEATPESTASISDLVPGAELVVFEESAHTAPLEERDRFLAVVRDFLARAEAA